jgi:putative ABC transport system substrate-binding protein
MRRRESITLLGGAAVWPLLAHAQQTPKVPRIGILATEPPVFDSIRQGFTALGYVEGQNIAFEKQGDDLTTDRLPIWASELVRLKVDVIIAIATPAGRAAQRATATIPIVVGSMGDPVQDGLVASLAHPGGNITGTTILGPELLAKRLALLKELLPTVSRVAGLWQPDAFGEQTNSDMLKVTADAATTLGVQLQLVEVRKPEEFERAFTDMAQGHAEALLSFPSPMFYGQRKRIVDLAAIHRLPVMYNLRQFVEIGGLIAYGPNNLDLTRRTAVYADKILKGAKPSDLPVERPTKFELVINLKTARALGLQIPPSLLARADEVVE